MFLSAVAQEDKEKTHFQDTEVPISIVWGIFHG